MLVVLVEDVAFLDIGRDTICMEQAPSSCCRATCDIESCAMPPGIVISSGSMGCAIDTYWNVNSWQLALTPHFEFLEVVPV